jgi:hypothetical protein
MKKAGSLFSSGRRLVSIMPCVKHPLLTLTAKEVTLTVPAN